MTTHEQIKSHLAQIEQRENAATPAPWHVDNNVPLNHHFCRVKTESGFSLADVRFDVDEPEPFHQVRYTRTADFIAHSRTDVPHLRKSLILSLECMKAVNMAIQTGHVHEVPGIIESFQKAIEEELKS